MEAGLVAGPALLLVLFVSCSDSRRQRRHLAPVAIHSQRSERAGRSRNRARARPGPIAARCSVTFDPQGILCRVARDRLARWYLATAAWRQCCSLTHGTSRLKCGAGDSSASRRTTPTPATSGSGYRDRRTSLSERRERAARARGARDPQNAELHRSESRRRARPQHGRIRDHGLWSPRIRTTSGVASSIPQEACVRRTSTARRRAKRKRETSVRHINCTTAIRMSWSPLRRISASTLS